jgi:tetratricopeptide (TPR) repeat protein
MRATVAINKNKINDTALKFIQKGQIKKAIREYEKILADDPSDVRTLLKKGDLLVRVGERNNAVNTYLSVANAYSQQGFHLKAVAVFKQIIKIDSSRIDVNLRLAEEYQNLGIVGDAMTHLQFVAAHYDRQGNIRESLNTLRRIVELDPDNIGSRIKLAELYSREQVFDRAIEEFGIAAEELKNANRIEDYIKVAERLIYHDPNNIQLIKELANIYLQRGDTKRALGKLQICFKADAQDLETLSMLAMAFGELNQPSKTVSVYKEMAKIYSDTGDSAKMMEVYRRIQELDPDDPDARDLLGGVSPPALPMTDMEEDLTMSVAEAYVEIETVEYDTDDDSLTVVAAYPEEQDPETSLSNQVRELIARLLTETDVYIKYGLHNKAYEHLNRVFEQDPNNIEAHDKLKELYLAANQKEHACQEFSTLIQLCIRVGRADDARAYLRAMLSVDPGYPDVGNLQALVEQYAPVAEVDASSGHNKQMQVENPDLVTSDASVVLVDDAETYELEESVELNIEFDEDSSMSSEVDVDMDATQLVVLEDSPDILDDEEEEAETIVSYGGDYFESSEELEDLPDLDDLEDAFNLDDDELRAELESAMQVDVEELKTRPADMGEFDLEAMETELPILADDDEVVLLDVEEAELIVEDEAILLPGDEASLPELTGVNESEQKDEPAVSRDELVVEEAGLPGADELAVEDGGLLEVADDLISEEIVSASLPDSPEDGDTELEDGLEEVEFFTQQNLLDEAADSLAVLQKKYPDHSAVQEQVAILERLQSGESPVARDMAEDPGEPFDLAAEIEREADFSPIDDEFQYSVDDVFSEFKKGVAKVVEQEDSATHFDLGIAYKEMGLLDDAISEFRVAGHDVSKRVSAQSMIGLCFAEQGKYDEAIESYKETIGQPDNSTQELVGLYYDLGVVYEETSDMKNALRSYTEVYKRDSKYRDITPKLKVLVKTAAAQKAARAGTKQVVTNKDKISFM